MTDGALIDAGGGRIRLSGDGGVTLGGLTTTNTGATAVTLVSVSGSVIDGGDTNVDVFAPGGGLVIEANENQFVCPCHGSHFDAEGDVENPPAPRALDTFAVTIEDGQVLVDTSRPQTRDKFAPEQLIYA